LTAEYSPLFEETFMNTTAHNHSDFFLRAVVAVAILAPILLVMIAGTMDEGLARGQLIVSGHLGVVAILATALVLRAVYGLGFSKARQLAASQPNQSLTA
jgi:hypothetical protein